MFWPIAPDNVKPAALLDIERQNHAFKSFSSTHSNGFLGSAPGSICGNTTVLCVPFLSVLIAVLASFPIMSLAHNRYNAFGADASNRSFYGQTEDGARFRCSRSASGHSSLLPSSRCMDYIRNPASDPARHAETLRDYVFRGTSVGTSAPAIDAVLHLPQLGPPPNDILCVNIVMWLTADRQSLQRDRLHQIPRTIHIETAL